MLTIIALHLNALIKARRDRAVLRRLLTEKEYALDDMGLTRSDVEAALGLSYRSDIATAARNLSARTLGMDRRRT